MVSTAALHVALELSESPGKGVPFEMNVSDCAAARCSDSEAPIAVVYNAKHVGAVCGGFD